LHGQDLLKQGLIWRIGDGTKVDIWSSNWIPREGAQHPLGRKSDAPQQPCRKVADLLNDEGTDWDITKLNRFFYEFYVADILNVGIGGAGIEDRVAWNFTMNSVFSVSSA
jgi:hypothetical protein